MKHQGPFVNLVLPGRVPVPQTPFLGVLGLWYIRESHSEGHRGPKSASRAKSPITDFHAVLRRRRGLSRTENCTVTSKIRVLCDPSAPIPPAGPRAPTQARNTPNARNRDAQSNISPNFIFLPLCSCLLHVDLTQPNLTWNRSKMTH